MSDVAKNDKDQGRPDSASKVCFVIAPIGDSGTTVRIRSDQILNHIIGPVVREFGYEAIRADGIADPGMIDRQILNHIVEDALVVADLSGHNPNVFYELAVRHMLAKPTITLIAHDEQIPFDLLQNRTIKVDHTDLDRVEAVKGQLREAIAAAESSSEPQDNPVSFAMHLVKLSASPNPDDQLVAQIMELHSDILGGFARFERKLDAGRADDEDLLLQAYAHGLAIRSLAVAADHHLDIFTAFDDEIDSSIQTVSTNVQDVLLNAKSLRIALQKRLPLSIRTKDRIASAHTIRISAVEALRQEEEAADNIDDVPF